MDTFFNLVSAVAALASVFFAYKTILEARNITFIPYKNELALTMHDLKCKIEIEGTSFKISQCMDSQRIILNSKIFISSGLYDKITDVLMSAHNLESLIKYKSLVVNRGSSNGEELGQVEKEISQTYIDLFEKVKLAQCDIPLAS